MRKTLSIISVVLCVAMLMALLPVMTLTGSAASSDLLGGKGAFDDLSLFTLEQYSYCELHCQGEGGSCVEGHTSGHSAVADPEVFTLAAGEGVDGSSALKITPTACGGNTPESFLITGMEPNTRYTVSAKIKWQGAYMLWNMYAPSIDSMSARWANMYLIGTDGNAYAQTTGPDADGWYTWSVTIKGGSDAWESMTMVPSVYAVGATGDVASGTAVDAANHWILLDDLTIVEHEHADANEDGTCDTTVYEWTKAANTTANWPAVYSTCASSCVSMGGSVEEEATDLFGGAYTGDYQMDLTSAGNGYTGWATIEPNKVYELHYWYQPTGTNTTSRVNTEFATDKSSNALRINNYGNTAAIETDANGYNHHVCYIQTAKEVHNSVRFQIWNTSSSTAGGGIVKNITLVEHEHVATDLTGVCKKTVYTYPADGTAGLAYSACADTCNGTIESDDLLYGFGSMDNQAAVDQVFDSATYNATEGAAQLGISGAQNTVDIPMEPGVIYTLSFKMKFVGTPGQFIMGIMKDADQFNTGLRWFSPGYADAVGTWAERSYTFCADTWETVGIRFLPSGANLTNFYVDDFKIVKHTHAEGDTVDALCDTKYYHYDNTESGLVSPSLDGVCGADMSSIAGATATLSDVIKLNLRVLSGSATNKIVLDPTEFVNNKSQEAAGYELALTATETANVYTASVLIPAKNMADTITAKLVNAEGTELDTFKASVRDYAMEIINGTSAEYVAAAPVAKALLNYGAAAQVNFGYKTNDLANKLLSAADQEISVEDIAGVANDSGAEEVPAILSVATVGSYGAHDASDFTMVDNYAQGAGYKISPIANRSAAFSYARFGSEMVSGDVGSGKTYTLRFWAKLTDGDTTDAIGVSTVLYKRTLTSAWQTLGLTLNNADGNWHYYELDVLYEDINTSFAGIQFQSTLAVGSSIEFAGMTVQEKYDSEEMVSNPNWANITTLTNGSELNGWRVRGNDIAIAYDETMNTNVLTLVGTNNWTRVKLDSTLYAGTTYQFEFDAKVIYNDANYNGLNFAGHGVSVGDATGETACWTAVSASDMDANGWKHYVYTFTPDPDKSVAGASSPYLTFAARLDYIYNFANFTFFEVVPEVEPIDTYKATITVDDAYKAHFKGYTMILRDQTSVRLYFDEAVTGITIDTVDAAASCEIGQSGSLYYVQLPAAKAAELSAAKAVAVTTASGSVTLVNFSTLAPAALAAGNTSKPALANVSVALILYAEAVNAYIA